jgi:hypothetical protein
MVSPIVTYADIPGGGEGWKRAGVFSIRQTAMFRNKNQALDVK